MLRGALSAALLPPLLATTFSCAALGPPGTAFPGAIGHGRLAKGGRGGAIVAVTTLADGGPGSLRACIDRAGPRTCVFRVAGTIRFTGRPPVIRNPFITIAGQTAPGGGVVLAHSGGALGFTPLVIKNTHDVIVRNIRVRPDRPGLNRGANDAYTIENSRNVILDHVSGSWAMDENVNGYAQNDGITISRSIFAEGLRPHDKCALLGGNPTGPQRLSFIGNLCAHNGDRNPDVNFTPGSCVEVINNVVYNAGAQFAEVWESYGGSPVSIVANYFRAGPDTARSAAAVDRQLIGSTGAARIHLAGNLLDGVAAEVTPAVAGTQVPDPVCPLTITPEGAQAAYQEVLERAGAFPRDAVDRRVVREVRERRGSLRRVAGTLPAPEPGTPYPDRDGDGMSDRWEAAHGLDPTRNDAWQDADGDGWANLDAFLAFAEEEVMAGRAVE